METTQSPRAGDARAPGAPQAGRSRGPQPDPRVLRAAVEIIVARLRPDQIILFGSAARGEMTEHSDLDLLVIREHAPDTEPHHLWACGDTGREMDVIVSSRARAEAGRRCAADVRGAALEGGRTIWAREGFQPLATGPSYIMDGDTMVRRTLYEPDQAHRFLARAERKWRFAVEFAWHPADRCENLQAAMEQALKGLIVAQGRRVEHKHELNDLWDEVERDGQVIAAQRNRADLQQLSLYAGIYQYHDPRDGLPEETWNATRTTGEDVLNHARARIPKLVAETTERLRRSSAT